MSALTDVDTSTMIYKLKCPTGERACIVGTGTSVKMIAKWINSGGTLEELLEGYPHLSQAQVNAAVAYYHVNRHEIDQAIELDREAGRRLAAKGRKA